MKKNLLFNYLNHYLQSSYGVLIFNAKWVLGIDLNLALISVHTGKVS